MRQFKLIFFLLFILGTVIYAQMENSDAKKSDYEILYQTARLQFSILVPDTTAIDGFLRQLWHDARASADSSQFKTAYEIMETLIEMAADEPAETEPPPDPVETNSSLNSRLGQPIYQWNLQLETGLDYSRQEFEMSFIDSDSTLKEELQNPFVSLYFNQKFNFSKMPLNLTHRFRLDNEFVNYSISGILKKESSSLINKIELESEAFWDQKNDQGFFLDNDFRYFVGNSSYFDNRWYLDTRVRYKWFPSGDSSNNNIFSAATDLQFEHYFGLFNYLSFAVSPEYYRENRQLGQNYKQISLGMGYNYRRRANRQWEAGIELDFRDFRNVVNDQEYQNQYININPEISGEWAWLNWLGNQLKVYYQKQNYREANDITPDLEQVGFEWIQKFYFSELNSFGVGYFAEKNLNSTDSGNSTLRTRDVTPVMSDVSTAFIEQQNYNSRGLVFTFDWLKLSGLFFNLEYRIKWDSYPNSTNSPFLPYYSDRITNSVSGFGWLPIARDWQIQFFINYDNDHKRKIENSDNRNTVFNLSLVYQF